MSECGLADSLLMLILLIVGFGIILYSCFLFDSV